MSDFFKSRLFLISIVVVALAATLPLYVSGYVLGLLTVAYYFGVFAMAWDLLFGFAGEVNFGPTFLIGVGAYTAGILNNQYGLSVYICIVLGALAAVVAGFVLALPALRVRGPYFGLTTLVAVLMLQNFIVVFADLTGGEIGLTIPDVITINANANYWIALGFMTVSAAILYGLSQSPLGLVLQASGQDPVQAGALGFNIVKHKLFAFIVSAFFSGLSGALLVFYFGHRLGRDRGRRRGRGECHRRRGARRPAHRARRRAGRDLPDRRRRILKAHRRARHLHRLLCRPARRAVLPRRLPRSGPAARGPLVMDATTNPILQVRGLVKRFGGLTAVKNLSLDVRPGEIFGLIGPNGSGKSTAMKSIMGIERPTAGEVIFQGENVAGLPAHKIARKGFGMVFQHSRPLNRQTVLENIMVALLPDSLFMLFADKALTERAKWIAERVGLGAVMDRRPPTLPFADLRRLELAKAIARDPKVVLVDEPFAGLTLAEVGTFSELIRSFRDEGRAVLLVDHNVKSVAALVDRVLAMYLGEEIVTGRADEVMRNETVRRVYLGGAIETSARPETSFKDKVPALQVENISVHYGKAQALENVSIHIHHGEFVSVVGLNGAGKTTLFNAISGFLPYTGEIVRDGEKLRGISPARIARSGIVQCPESRELFGEMSVRENLDLGGQHLSNEDKAKQLAWLFELFPILKERQGQLAQTLSGGEQQMLAIGRALMMQPKILILDEPTLGLAPVILEQLSKALEKLRQTTPITVLLGEQNVTFALPHADRVYVLEHARIVWEGDPGRFAAEAGEGYL